MPLVATNVKSFRLDEGTLRLLELLGQRLGLSDTGVMKQAVRLLARREQVELPPKAEPNRGGRPRKK